MSHRHTSSVSALKFSDAADPARKALELQKTIASFQDSISALERCRYPVIVATHGVAYGLSIDIIAACDVRYTASNTIFSIKVRSYSSQTLHCCVSDSEKLGS